MLHSKEKLTDIQLRVLHDTLDKLTVFNTPDFWFDEGPHKYYLRKTELTSVTTYLHHFSKPFDEVYWSKKKARDRDTTPEIILEEWKSIADRACYLGSEVHKWIEDFYNGTIRPLLEMDEEVQERIGMFQIIYEKRLFKLFPIAQELRMFNLDMKLAGTLDALFLGEDGKIYILDYKTNKALKTDKDYSFSNMLYEFSTEKDNNMNHYSVQTSIYRLMLAKVGVFAAGCFIVYIPPQGECQIIKCKDYRQQLVRHFNLDPVAYGLA